MTTSRRDRDKRQNRKLDNRSLTIWYDIMALRKMNRSSLFKSYEILRGLHSVYLI